MVERRVCTFCGDEIEPGTGRMYIKKDGVVYNFCTSKCYKNLVILRRVPRRTTWTQYYAREKQVRMKGAPAPQEQAPKAKKIKKSEVEPAAKKESEQPKAEEKKETPKEEKPKAEEKKPQAKAPVKRTVKKAEGAKKEPSKTEQKAKPAEAGKE
jgi:large subunit ribosomal protein L24e